MGFASCRQRAIGDAANSGITSGSNRPANSGKNHADAEVPSAAVTEGVVKETMSLLAAAVEEGSFSQIYEQSSSDFQANKTEEQMQAVFASFIEKKAFVVPILKMAAEMSPTFEPLPSIRIEKGLNVLVLGGTFETKPSAVRFETEYVLRDDKWRLLSLEVSIR